MNTYSTRDEATFREIVEPIGAGDVQDVHAEFDVDAIADEVLGGYGEGYALRADHDEFWVAVERHAYPLYTATLPEHADRIHVEVPDAEDDDLAVIGDKTVFTVVRTVVTEEWEPEVYRQSLTDAGWVPVGDFETEGADLVIKVRLAD